MRWNRKVMHVIVWEAETEGWKVSQWEMLSHTAEALNCVDRICIVSEEDEAPETEKYGIKKQVFGK